MAQAPSAPSNTAAKTPIKESPGMFKIGALSDPTRKKYLKMLVYGAPGAGKTTLLGSAVDVNDLQDVLLCSFEGGEMVLEDNERVKNSEQIDTIRIFRLEQLQKIYEFLQAHCKYRDAEDEAGLEKLQRMVFGLDEDEEVDRIRHYRTVIIDSLTEIEAANLSKILNLDAQGLDAAGDLEVAGFTEFRRNNHAIQRIVRSLRDLPLNVLLVCAQQYSQDDLKRLHYAPALTGKLSTQVQGFMDIVGWLVVGISENAEEGAGPRRLWVQPQIGPRADAKNRIASYKKAYFDDPSMRSIMQATGFIKPTNGK